MSLAWRSADARCMQGETGQASSCAPALDLRMYDPASASVWCLTTEFLLLQNALSSGRGQVQVRVSDPVGAGGLRSNSSIPARHATYTSGSQHEALDASGPAWQAMARSNAHTASQQGTPAHSSYGASGPGGPAQSPPSRTGVVLPLAEVCSTVACLLQCTCPPPTGLRPGALQ